MDQYQINLTALGALCTVLLACQPVSAPDAKRDAGKSPRTNPQLSFYAAYALMMGADWLQGPYLYSLYQEEHGLPSTLISTLFTTGFISGGLSAYWIGSLADIYGRKTFVLLFCALYSLSCILTTLPVVSLLFLGRLLGGISTSILFSVVDSWLVTDFKARRLGEKGCDLSRNYGVMSTVNSLTAIISGVFSEALVSTTGTKRSPFLASVVLLAMASYLVSQSWGENYGLSKTEKQIDTSSTSLWSALKKPSLLALLLTTTIFEASMYLFVFFWVPALKSVKSSTEVLPFGIIFASFMASVMAASLTFNIVMQRRMLKYSRLLILVLVVSNFVFVKLASPTTEQATFWLFCLFEACVGLYWPCMGYLKGRMIEDGVRAKFYSFMRIPLNIIVVISLVLSRKSDDFGRVFSVCSVLLTAAFGAVWASTLKGEAI